MTEWDVAVIGGGVAGSTAAALLAQRGLRVILIEKDSLPRQKVCGEFLSPEGADVLRRLGVWPRIEAHHPPRIHGFALTVGQRETRHTLPLPGWGVSRWVLDYALWEFAGHCGVATLEHCTVEQVTGDFQSGFSLALWQAGQLTRLQARAVLCAAGRQWRPRRQPRSPHEGRRSRFVGLKAHFARVALGGHVELHTIRHGYCGMVEVTGGVANLCCWVESEALRCTGSTPHRFLAAALAENSCLRSRLQKAQPTGTSWTTTSFVYGKTIAPVAAGVWNIGDCATMVAPLTGDGMGMGLRSAELAATILRAVFWQECTWEQASTEYARCWQREFVPRLRWGRGLEAMLLHPRLALLACVALHCAPSFMDRVYLRTRQLFPVIAPPREAS
jgi:menaquinone-9 beta-reductase